MKKQQNTSAQSTTTTTTPTPATTAPQSTSIEHILREWADLQKLEEKKLEIEAAMQLVRDRLSPSYRHLGTLLGQVDQPIKPQRKPTTPRAPRVGGGKTQVDLAKELVSSLPSPFTIDQFRDGMTKAGLTGNVHNVLGKMKNGNVILAVEGQRGVFKKV